MEQVVNLIVNNGMGIVLMAYFIYKDYKFNDAINGILCEIKEVLVELKTWHAKDEK